MNSLVTDEQAEICYKEDVWKSENQNNEANAIRTGRGLNNTSLA